LQGINLNPFRLATSRGARRAYLGAVFFAAAAALLLGVAVVAYVVFYAHYVPVRGFTAPAHLQFGRLLGSAGAGVGRDEGKTGRAAGDHNLRAAARLPEGYLVAGQAYDVAVELRMPRAPRNVEAGNFMLDLRLLAAASAPTSAAAMEQGGYDAAAAAAAMVAHQRRPASLTYRSPLVDLALKTVALPLYVVGWWREEERLVVSLMEDVTFAGQGRRRAMLPTDARIEILTDGQLQVYSAQISFRTRLKGLRSVICRVYHAMLTRLKVHYV